MSTNPSHPNSEALRLACLRELLVLDSGPEPLFDNITRLASQVCGMPIALISLVDAERQWFKSNVGLTGVTETPRELAFCAHTIQSDAVLEVPDAFADPRFATNPLVTGPPDIRFYAGAPLVLEHGARVGTLCVIDHEARRLDAAQRAMLISLAAVASKALTMRRDLINASLSVSNRYEEVLAVSEERYRVMVEEQTELVSLVRSDGRIHYSNPACARFLGRTPQLMLETVWLDCFEPADRDSVRVLVAKVLADGIAQAGEHRVLAGDGSVRWVAWTLRRQVEAQQLMLHCVGRDITEQRAAETSLQRSETRFRTTFDLAAVGMALVALDGHWLRVNQKLCDIIGYKPEELLGNSFQDITHPDDLSADLGLVQRVLAGEISSYTLEKRYVHRDGHIVWIELTVALVRDSNGVPVNFISVVNDVDARHRAEDELRQKSDLLTEAQRIAHVGSYRLERGGSISWSDEMYRLHGVEPTSFSPSMVSLPELIHPEDRERVKAQIMAVLAGELPVDLELRVVWPDGSVRCLLARAEANHDAAGQVIGMSGTVQDITEQRTAQMALSTAASRYRQLFDANPNPMWIFDAARLAFVAVNDAAVRHYGYSRKEFLTMSIEDIRAPNELPRLHAVMDDLPRQLTVRRLRQHRCKDGRVIDVEITAQPIEFNGRDASVVLANDVTEQRLAVEQVLKSRSALRSLLQRLQRAQEAERTRVAREIHDELGQMLTSLKMDLRWIERRLSAPGAVPGDSELLDRALAASALNEQMIVTVQAISAELRPAGLDHLGLPAALAQRARLFQQRTGTDCTLRIEEPLDALPAIVTNELYYICQEALTNVTRHGHATEVRIDLRSSTEGVEMVVEDNGIGIDPAMLAAPHSLGLIGMRERALLCFGTVLVERATPHGTRITVKMPLAPEPA